MEVKTKVSAAPLEVPFCGAARLPVTEVSSGEVLNGPSKTRKVSRELSVDTARKRTNRK